MKVRAAIPVSKVLSDENCDSALKTNVRSVLDAMRHIVSRNPNDIMECAELAKNLSATCAGYAPSVIGVALLGVMDELVARIFEHSNESHAESQDKPSGLEEAVAAMYLEVETDLEGGDSNGLSRLRPPSQRRRIKGYRQ